MHDAAVALVPDAATEPVAPPPTGTLPAVDDVWAPGPFATRKEPVVGVQSHDVLFLPDPLGKDGVKHPIVIWDRDAINVAAAAEVPDDKSYDVVGLHLASHGFAVYATEGTQETGAKVGAAIDWMLSENERSESQLYQRLDRAKVGAVGDFRGAVALYAAAGDPRLNTTVHLYGELMPPWDAVKLLSNLRAPAAFVCGVGGYVAADPLAHVVCEDESFAMVTAPKLQAKWLGSLFADNPPENGVSVGWLRWRLAGDITMKAMFVGDDCALCVNPDWNVEQSGLQ